MPFGSSKAAMMGAAGGGSFEASGGTETTYSDSGNDYKAHTFNSSGTFTIAGAGDATIDFLIIAGGGSAGHYINAGAGGAGGYREFTGISAVDGDYTVTIGAGGATVSGTSSASGSNSSFQIPGVATYSATGGGRGGYWGTNPLGGGSGGGGAGSGWHGGGNKGAGNAGGYSPVEGHDGGENLSTWNGNSSGGGGASVRPADGHRYRGFGGRWSESKPADCL